MKRYLTTVFLISIPFIVYSIFVLILDPFGYLAIDENNQAKSKLSYKIDHVLWKSIKYKNDPKPIVLLGDSRVTDLSHECFGANSNEFSNMALKGLSLEELFDYFWEIVDQEKLEKVYIGIGFHEYNLLNNTNRTREAHAASNNIIGYLVSKSVMKASFYYLQEKLLNAPPKVNSTKKKNWDDAISFIERTYFKNYVYPEHYLNKMKSISDYCKKEQIELIFFIPPNHVDITLSLEKFKLIYFEKQFISDLNSIGKVIDFTADKSLTSNKVNFSDPFHFSDSTIKNAICRKLTSVKE